MKVLRKGFIRQACLERRMAKVAKKGKPRASPRFHPQPHTLCSLLEWSWGGRRATQSTKQLEATVLRDQSPFNVMGCLELAIRSLSGNGIVALIISSSSVRVLDAYPEILVRVRSDNADSMLAAPISWR